MPELLRAYGEIFRREPHGLVGILAVLIGIVLLLLTVVIVGALIERVATAWRRASFHLTTTRRPAPRGPATGRRA